MKPISNKDNYIEEIPSFESKEGENYGKGLKIKEITIDNELKDGTLDRYYQLIDRYNRFEAYLAPDKSWLNGLPDSNIGELNIYADNKLIYQSGPINSESKPMKISVPLVGVKNLDLQIQNGANICLVDSNFFLN